MPEPHPNELPPLGEPSPALDHRRQGLWYRRVSVVAVVALLVGSVVGFGVGRSLDSRSTAETPKARPSERPTVGGPSTTVVTVPALPADCSDALRSAEQALQLLAQGFESLRRFHVDRIDAVLADLDWLRGHVTARVVACQEQLRR